MGLVKKGGPFWYKMGGLLASPHPTQKCYQTPPKKPYPKNPYFFQQKPISYQKASQTLPKKSPNLAGGFSVKRITK